MLLTINEWRRLIGRIAGKHPVGLSAGSHAVGLSVGKRLVGLSAGKRLVVLTAGERPVELSEENGHSSVFWKAFQISRNYYFLIIYIHFRTWIQVREWFEINPGPNTGILTWIAAIQFQPHRYVSMPGCWVNANVTSYDCFIQCIDDNICTVLVGVIFLELENAHLLTCGWEKNGN